MVFDDRVDAGRRLGVRLRHLRGEATRVVLAVPVAPPGWQDRIGRDADEMISVATPVPFHGIGQFYADFSQTIDDEVVTCLVEAASGARDRSADPAPAKPVVPHQARRSSHARDRV